MIFHTFGNKDNRSVILVHGVLTPWQIWEKQISVLKEKYYVIVPALDGHIEDRTSEYISAENEAEQIEKYINDELDGTAHALCGLSMGGVIANRVFERNKIKINRLVLDGAPLIKISSLSNKFMTVSYKSIIHKSKSRDSKTLENFKRDFLPEKFLEPYLKFADTMSDSTVENMIDSVCTIVPHPRENTGNTKIMFLHGTKGNEVYSKRTADMMKQYYPDMTVKCFKGYKHAELAIYKPDEWLETVEPFISAE
ncbi:MAG: alpha/beta hydrolase [Oscillospiraceae bacterium]|nr:alpha/beta hydrolase [Oscillospiraceae bacterium]